MEDAEAIFSSYACDTEVTKYLVWKPHESIETTRDFLRQCFASLEAGDELSWVITRKEDGRILGMIGLYPRHFKAALGYVLARSFWNQGYATEAVCAVVEWAHARAEIHRVWAVCDVENQASARVLEKAGMQREGLLRRWMIHPNVSDLPRDCWCYAKVKG